MLNKKSSIDALKAEILEKTENCKSQIEKNDKNEESAIAKQNNQIVGSDLRKSKAIMEVLNNLCPEILLNNILLQRIADFLFVGPLVDKIPEELQAEILMSVAMNRKEAYDLKYLTLALTGFKDLLQGCSVEEIDRYFIVKKEKIKHRLRATLNPGLSKNIFTQKLKNREN